ncbi:hypothetical protein LDL59_07935 [Kaistella anthropi]|nr:hypothetical protein [Kaistella anthropi]
MEDLITFDNTKESLSAFTNGFTDKYLKEETHPDGEKKLAINTDEIVKEFSNSVKDKVLNRNSVYAFAKSDAGMNLVENALKIGAVSFVGNYAKKVFTTRAGKRKSSVWLSSI